MQGFPTLPVESQAGARDIPDRHKTAHPEGAQGRVRRAQQRGHRATLGTRKTGSASPCLGPPGRYLISNLSFLICQVGFMPPTPKGWWEASRDSLVRYSAQTPDLSAQQTQTRETTRGQGMHTHTQVRAHTGTQVHAATAHMSATCVTGGCFVNSSLGHWWFLHPRNPRPGT